MITIRTMVLIKIRLIVKINRNTARISLRMEGNKIRHQEGGYDETQQKGTNNPSTDDQIIYV